MKQNPPVFLPLFSLLFITISITICRVKWWLTYQDICVRCTVFFVFVAHNNPCKVFCIFFFSFWVHHHTNWSMDYMKTTGQILKKLKSKTLFSLSPFALYNINCKKIRTSARVDGMYYRWLRSIPNVLVVTHAESPSITQYLTMHRFIFCWLIF